MRTTLYFLAAAIVTTPASAAFAQGAITFGTMNEPVSRQNNPRNQEMGVVGGVRTTDPIGVRDCECEFWRFPGTFTPPANSANVNLEWWVGSDPMACAQAVNRITDPNVTTFTTSTPCWQVLAPGVLPVPNPGAGSNIPFSVDVPSRYLIDPLEGRCTPRNNRAQSGTFYFTGLIRTDPMAVIGTFAIPYNLNRPEPATSVTPQVQEGAVSLSWTIGTASVDGGMTMRPANLAGYWVLCSRRPLNFDAGTMDSACDAAMDVAERDTGVEPGTCGARPPDVDTSNSAEFERFRCSGLIAADRQAETITGLENGVEYRFSIVTQDNAGNRSAPSPWTDCVTPQPVTDFWEHYRNRGGQAEPGFCAARPGRVGGTGGASAALLAAAALVLGARRRRRRDREVAS